MRQSQDGPFCALFVSFANLHRPTRAPQIVVKKCAKMPLQGLYQRVFTEYSAKIKA